MSETELHHKCEIQRGMLLRIQSFNRIENEINLIHHEDLTINPLDKEEKKVIHWQIWNVPIPAIDTHFQLCKNAIATDCWCLKFDIAGDLPLWTFKQHFLNTYKNISAEFSNDTQRQSIIINIRLDIERAKNLQSRIENIIFDQLDKLEMNQLELYEYRLMKELLMLNEIRMFLISKMNLNGKLRKGIATTARETIARPVFIYDIQQVFFKKKYKYTSIYIFTHMYFQNQEQTYKEGECREDSEDSEAQASPSDGHN